MERLTRADGDWPLFVEWPDDARALVSREAARGAARFVLTRSALATAQQAGLLDTVLSRRCIAPRSLKRAVRGELLEAEQRVTDGWHVMKAADTGLGFEGFPAGHAVLTARRDSLKHLMAKLDETVEFVPRPLEAFGDPIGGDDLARKTVGDAASDALELSRFLPGTLYADDLGLRMLADGLGVSSCSTVSIVQALAESGGIPTSVRDEALADLVEWHYCAIPPSAELLVEAMSPARSGEGRRWIFGLLAAQQLELGVAARILVRAVRLVALQPVVTFGIGEMVRMGLDALKSRAPHAVVAHAVASLAARELALLPAALRGLNAACQEFRMRSEKRV